MKLHKNITTIKNTVSLSSRIYLVASYVEEIVLALLISANDRLIYQYTNYLEYNATYQTKITQTGDFSLGYKPVIPQYTCTIS